MDFTEIREIVREPFFINWFLINLGFLLAGVLLGRMFFTTGKSKIAYQDALDKAQKEHEKEKQGFSNEVSAQLAELRDGILNSAQAYQKAIEVIGGHIGSTENFNNLLIEQTSKEKNITEESNSVIEKEEITEGKIIEEKITAEEIPAHEIIANSVDEKIAQANA